MLPVGQVTKARARHGRNDKRMSMPRRIRSKMRSTQAAGGLPLLALFFSVSLTFPLPKGKGENVISSM
jgi:hypothetical protein